MSNKFGIRDRNVAFKLTGVLFFVGRIMKKSFMTSLSNWLSTEIKRSPVSNWRDSGKPFADDLKDQQMFIGIERAESRNVMAV